MPPTIVSYGIADLRAALDPARPSAEYRGADAEPTRNIGDLGHRQALTHPVGTAGMAHSAKQQGAPELVVRRSLVADKVEIMRS